MVRLLPHYDEPDLVFGNIGGNSLTVPASLWEGGALGPRRAPPGVWCGVVWCGVVWTKHPSSCSTSCHHCSGIACTEFLHIVKNSPLLLKPWRSEAISC